MKRTLKKSTSVAIRPKARSVKRVVVPLVRCHHCNGRGKIPLSQDMALTLDAVKYLGESDASEVRVAVWADVGVTAINNRLEDLRMLGLVTRRRSGKRWLYRHNGLHERPGANT